MITDYDIRCFMKWCINKNIDVKRTKEKYYHIKSIVDVLAEGDNTPVDIKNKISCLSAIINRILDGHSIEGAISNVLSTPKFKESGEASFVTLMASEETNEEEFDGIVKTIESKYKNICIQKSMPKMEELFNTLKDGKYDSSDEGYGTFKNLVSELHNNVRYIDNIEAMASESVICIGDGNTDDTTKVLKRFNDKYDRSKKIPTGFQYIDDVIMRGGFDRNRLYIIGGSSGAGKSTMLLNFALNAAKWQYYVGELKKKKKIFIYITLENDKEETIGRMMCAHWDLPSLKFESMVRDNPKEVAKEFEKDISKYNSMLYIHQFSVESITSSSIAALIEELTDVNGGKDKCIVAAVYIDYLDLLKCNNLKKDLRLNLTEITKELKELSRDYEIPIITATQLNREGYNITNAYQLSAKAMGESMGKVHIADFVAMICKDQFNEQRVFWNVVKFRSGNTGSALDFKVNFENFKFIDCEKSKSESKEVDSVIPSDPSRVIESPLYSKGVHRKISSGVKSYFDNDMGPKF